MTFGSATTTFLDIGIRTLGRTGELDMSNLVYKWQFRMADDDLFVDVFGDGTSDPRKLTAVFRRNCKSDFFRRQDGVNISSPRDVHIQLSEFSSLYLYVSIENQGWRVDKGNFFYHAVYDFGFYCNDTGGGVQFDLCNWLGHVDESGFDEGYGYTHSVVAAHRHPAAGFKIQHSYVCPWRAGFRNQSAGHDFAAPGLEHQNLTEPVFIFPHIFKFFLHGFSGTWRNPLTTLRVGCPSVCVSMVLKSFLAFKFTHPFY